MSQHKKLSQTDHVQLLAMKERGEISMSTAHDFSMA
jgi:hypothetical protein